MTGAIVGATTRLPRASAKQPSAVPAASYTGVPEWRGPQPQLVSHRVAYAPPPGWHHRGRVSQSRTLCGGLYRARQLANQADPQPTPPPETSPFLGLA